MYVDARLKDIFVVGTPAVQACACIRGVGMNLYADAVEHKTRRTAPQSLDLDGCWTAATSRQEISMKWAGNRRRRALLFDRGNTPVGEHRALGNRSYIEKQVCHCVPSGGAIFPRDGRRLT